ncbi:efflux RND transporter periplasmic adaptor subunit [Sphingomonas sp. IC4-52]|uniref:efflux RND transporter periplasmic adaptor subunit n=1 Tax=Sphingomonas sp. IC4-52 TaxID=2887202 RepID=UPI001D112FBF|nr:efflux RND transporter periplasmic adaptor subunit [Sphingomonas sp. IC4-52]MCC2981242.1 efflux RND transporter periplasmic adaptor subunit [Sphingomonas sp. IC4-52]
MSLMNARGLVLCGALALAACGGQPEKGEERGPGGGRGGPAQVGYVVVQQTSVPLVTELAARTFAYQSSEVRPQVSGVIQKRFFEEGSIVRRGQPLYQIDPSLYRAAVNEATANVASARATAEAARVRADRFRPLAAIEAVSKQDYTDALATQRQAEASIAQNRAQLETARINLRFTTVPAPITGRIGRSLFTVGALVTSSQADPLTTIQQLDPIYVDIQQSAASLLQLRRRMASGGVLPASATVRLKLEDGSDYGATGTVEFSEVVVDQQTGTVTLRARFPNPNGLLLPGMFVRAVFAQAIETNAFLVPQTAVSRDPKGDATVWIVGPNNKAVQRTIQTVRAEGANWVVTGGLRAGDKVITQGTANLSPDAIIRPVPASAPQQPKPPSPEQLEQQQKAKGKAG